MMIVCVDVDDKGSCYINIKNEVGYYNYTDFSFFVEFFV